MNLIDNFSEEDLTPEAISKKIREMSFNESKLYLRQLPSEKRDAWVNATLKKYTNILIREDERCLRKNGATAREHYDAEHPCD